MYETFLIWKNVEKNLTATYSAMIKNFQMDYEGFLALFHPVSCEPAWALTPEIERQWPTPEARKRTGGEFAR